MPCEIRETATEITMKEREELASKIEEK